MTDKKEIKTLKVEKIEDSYWGNERVRNIETKRIYTKVDGVYHTTTKDGEPDCPLNNKIEIK